MNAATIRGMSDARLDGLNEEVGPDAAARLVAVQWMTELATQGFTFEQAAPLLRMKLNAYMAARADEDAETEAAFFACHPAD